MSHCGECTLCCRLLGIQSLDKPAGVWCKFCTPGKGCNIHDQPEFPADCADYVCLYRQMRDEEHEYPDALRPDRCKVIIDAAKYEHAHYVRCAPGYPHAWREPTVQRVLMGLAAAGSTVYLVTLDASRVLYRPRA